MIGLIWVIVKLLVILCIVATVHEFGHFIAAKLSKTGVKEFSIGFGPKIYQRKYKETMYSLRWLPFGGYVMIEGEGEESDKEDSLSNKSALTKIIIMVMGVVFNVILAFIILISVSFGYPTYTTKLTALPEDSALYQSGVREGDTITSINGNRTTLAEQLIDSKYDKANSITITYERDGVEYTELIDNAIQEVGYVGVVFIGVDDEDYPLIDMVRGGKPAENAGIKAGDSIVSINGEKAIDSSFVVDIIKSNANVDLPIQVKRNGKILDLTLTPSKADIFDLGIEGTDKVDTTLSLAFDKSVNTIVTVFNSYVDFVAGKVALDDISSVVGVGVLVSKTEGFLEYIYMLAVISLAIGAANLLPFPPLDGGKIVIVLIEAITRKKVSLKVETVISYIGFGCLIILAVVVTFKDVMRII